MAGQTRAAFTKEYTENTGVLIIENIFGDKPKIDVIKELIGSEACTCVTGCDSGTRGTED